ncbi:MAG: hypothetical protein WDO56_07645 [Gammaproteobacteria bacterium]
MATQKAMQAAGSVVTAAAPMSGPYALSAFGDAIFRGQVPKSGPTNLTLLISSYDAAYGDNFVNTTDIFEAKYAPASQRSCRARRPSRISSRRERSRAASCSTARRLTRHSRR